MIAFYNPTYGFNCITQISVNFTFSGDDGYFSLGLISDSTGTVATSKSLATVNTGGYTTKTFDFSNSTCYGVALYIRQGTSIDGASSFGEVKTLTITDTC